MVTIRIKRGTEANRLNTTPAVGELICTTDNNELFIGDGSTAGGIAVTKKVKDEILNKLTTDKYLTETSGDARYVNLDKLGVADGVATLGADGKVKSSQLPSIALTSVSTAADEAAMLALETQEGDVVIRTDETKTYIRNSGTAGTMADYSLLEAPSNAVTSVNGNNGVVTLDTDDIAEGTTNKYFTEERAKTAAKTVKITELADAPDGTLADKQILLYNSTSEKFDNVTLSTAIAGLLGFEDLKDTPAVGTMATSGSKLVAVSADGTGLEYIGEISGGTF